MPLTIFFILIYHYALLLIYYLSIWFVINLSNMLELNKIKHREQAINQSLGSFRDIVHSIKQNRKRQTQSMRVQQGQRSSEITNRNNSDIFCLQEKLPFYQSPLLNQNLVSSDFSKLKEDPTIKNKSRVQVANRAVMKRNFLPPQNFNNLVESLKSSLRNPRVPSKQQFQQTNQTWKNSNRYNEYLSKNNSSKRQEQRNNSSRILKQQIKLTTINDINPQIVLKYCLLHALSSYCSLKDIFQFFTKLEDLVNFKIEQPRIEKFKNCIYFGRDIKKNSFYQGFIYFYEGRIYYGQFFNQQKHGKGVQIIIEDRQTYRGQFKNGKKCGYFEVIKPNETYHGELVNGQYNGRGKLVSDQEIFQGQFRNGKKCGYGNEINLKEKCRLTGYYSKGKLLNGKESQRFERQESRYEDNAHQRNYQSGRFESRKAMSNNKESQRRQNIFDYNYAFDQNVEIANPEKTTRVRYRNIRKSNNHQNSNPKPKKTNYERLDTTSQEEPLIKYNY